MSRPRPRYGVAGVRLTEQAAREHPEIDHRTPAEQHVAVDLVCRECDRRLWRYCLDTFEGADGEVWVQRRTKQGQPLGYIPKLESGFLLIDCEHCRRDVNVPLAHVQAVLEHMRAPGRHAVERLPV